MITLLKRQQQHQQQQQQHQQQQHQQQKYRIQYDASERPLCWILSPMIDFCVQPLV
jgi:hypothetical protein